MTELIRLGNDIQIVSLKRHSESMVQSDAATLLERTHYPAPWLQTLVSVLTEISTHPLRELHDLFLIFLSLGRYPTSLGKTLVVWWRTLGLLPQIRKMKPTHIHAHWATYPSTAAMLLSKRLGVPYSFTAHAHDIFLENHLLYTKLKTAKFTVAISNFNKQFLREHVAGANKADIRIVHCGVSPTNFPMITEGRTGNLILAIGRLDDIKGFSYLIEACGILHSKGIDFQCDIVGSGPLHAALAARIDALNLTRRVRLLGAQKQEKVRELLHQAGIFALPCVVTSRGDRDGIPVALMEAMASGLPVISTRVSGVPELVEDGITGLLAESENAGDLARCLMQLLNDKALGEKLIARARQRVEQEFDIQKEALKLHDALTG